jgi:hypothetical protein
VLADDIRFLEHDLYGCEWLFYLEIVRRCRAGYVDEPLCLHHFVPGSLSRSSSIRNMVYHRSLLNIMRRRFHDCSPQARAEIDRQFREACRQLAFDSYRHREFAAACGYFMEASQERLDLSSAAGAAKSALCWLLSFGRTGDEPMLRTDPHEQPSTT